VERVEKFLTSGTDAWPFAIETLAGTLVIVDSMLGGIQPALDRFVIDYGEGKQS